MKLPRVGPTKIIKILERKGFVLTRSSGSHHIYKDQRGRRATIPFHSGKTLHPKILKSILKDAEITQEEFIELV